MGDIFRKAVSEISELPDEAQDEIGRQLLDYLRRLDDLRAEVDKGLASLDAGEGRELDIDQFIQELNERHLRGK